MSNLVAPHHLTPEDVIWQSPARMSGAPCFAGTRVPVTVLLDHLDAGDTVDEFLSGYPGVARWQAAAFLELAAQGRLTDYGVAPRVIAAAHAPPR